MGSEGIARAKAARWTRATRYVAPEAPEAAPPPAGADEPGTRGHRCDDDAARGGGSGGGSLRRPCCPICLDDVSCDAELACGHGFCESCVVRFLENCVNEGRVSSTDLCCPIPSCRLAFPEHFISQLLQGSPEGKRLHERLLDFQARRFVPEPSEGEKLVACPTPGCGKVLVPEEFVQQSRAVSCPLCSRGFCAGCGQAPHSGESCEDAEYARLDPEMRSLIAKENYVRCPTCRNLCERESGCNFMTCPSEQCQGKSHFCYICGEMLTSADHAAHFEGFDEAVGRMGPFGSVCANRRVVNLSLPTRPPPPTLSVVEGDDEGSIALRVTWGPHKSEPPTIAYRVYLTVPGTSEWTQLTAQAGEPHYDMKDSRKVQKYRRYQASVTPQNVNGAGESSDVSEIVHFHPRELVKEREQGAGAAAAAAPRNKRWATR